MPAAAVIASAANPDRTSRVLEVPLIAYFLPTKNRLTPVRTP
jgi:hypothetical protein